MLYDDSSSQTLVLGALVTLLVALAAVGCGPSHEDFKLEAEAEPVEGQPDKVRLTASATLRGTPIEEVDDSKISSIEYEWKSGSEKLGTSRQLVHEFPDRKGAATASVYVSREAPLGAENLEDTKIINFDLNDNSGQ